MDAQRDTSNELLTISQNANLSDGWMYPTDVDSLGRPIDSAWAASRVRIERLIEMKQIKGQSETHPLLSPNDEFANFEIMSFLIGLPSDSGRVTSIVGSYARQALKDGVTMERIKGYNSHKFGFVSGSDSHNTTAPYRANNAFAGHGINDDTFANSGTRIQVRMFGGWDFDEGILKDVMWVATGFEHGTPMGSDLAAAPAGAKAPSFLLWAVKDPTSANLDRIQVIKDWTKDGQSFEKVFNVVWSGDREPDPNTGKVPAILSTVDVKTGAYANQNGATEFTKVWTDPEIDPTLNAFYYARVLEIPTLC